MFYPSSEVKHSDVMHVPLDVPSDHWERLGAYVHEEGAAGRSSRRIYHALIRQVSHAAGWDYRPPPDPYHCLCGRPSADCAKQITVPVH